MAELQRLVAENAAEHLAGSEQGRRVPQPIYRASGPVAASFMPGYGVADAEVSFTVHGRRTTCSERDALLLLAVLSAALSAKDAE